MFVDGYPLVEKAITPDTPPEILTSISESAQLRPYKEELVKGAKVRQALMILRQERINEANRRIQHRLVEGIGEKVASIDLEIYFQMIAMYGPECWADPAFVQSFLDKNPGVRIRAHVPTRIVHPGLNFKQSRTAGSDPRHDVRQRSDARGARVENKNHNPAPRATTLITP